MSSAGLVHLMAYLGAVQAHDATSGCQPSCLPSALTPLIFPVVCHGKLQPNSAGDALMYLSSLSATPSAQSSCLQTVVKRLHINPFH